MSSLSSAISNSCTDVVHALVQYEGQWTVTPDGQALLVRQTRLLDVDIQVLDPVHHLHSLVHLPASVRIAHQRDGQPDLAQRSQLRCLEDSRSFSPFSVTHLRNLFI